MSLHDDFENEHDLSTSFENEPEVEQKPGLLSKGLDLASDAGIYLGTKGLDLAQGIASGASMGLLDEAGGALSAGAEALYNKFDPTNQDLEAKGFKLDKPGLGELYRKNQQDIQKELEASDDRSPILSGIGKVAGGFTTGGALLGGLGAGTKAVSPALTGSQRLLALAGKTGKLAAQGASLGAIEGAATSKEGGILTPEERSKLGGDIVSGAELGGILGPVMHTVGESAGGYLKNKIGGIIEDTPLLRQMKVAYGYGKQGINPKSQKVLLDTSPESLTRLDNKRSTTLVNEIQAADQEVGQAVGKSLQNADATFQASNKFINIDPDTRQALEQVKSLSDKYPELANNPRAKQIFDKISQSNPDVLPSEAKDLIDYMDAYIGKFKTATNKTPLEEGILGNLLTTRKSFSNTLKTQVPEYAKAAERFQQFRELVPETLLAGARDPNVVKQSFGKATDQELFDKIKPLLQGTTKQGAGAAPIRENFTQTIQGMKDFEASEVARLASGEISEPALKRPVSAIEEQIKKFSDDAVARGSMDAIEPHTGVGNLMKQTVTGSGDTGRSIALSSANAAGRISAGMSKNPVAQMSRNLYNAPQETISALSQKLKSSPGFEKYGNQLEHALQSPDQNRRNQVLFTIMQNPSARAFVDENEEK